MPEDKKIRVGLELTGQELYQLNLGIVARINAIGVQWTIATNDEQARTLLAEQKYLMEVIQPKILEALDELNKLNQENKEKEENVS